MLNNVHKADCIEFCTKHIADNSIDLIIADPPAFKLIKENWTHQWRTQEEYVQWLGKCIVEFERILKPTGSLYLYQWIGEKNPTTLANILIAINQITNLHLKNFITWRKDRGYGTQNNWMYAREEILFYTKKPKGYTFNVQYGNIKRNYIRKCGKSYYKRCGNVWVEVQNEDVPIQNVWDDISEQSYIDIHEQREDEYTLDTKAPAVHSTMKPLELSERIIKCSTNENDTVYIPFAGSGSEIISCIRSKRNFIATETDEHYIQNVILPRIESEGLKC